MKIWGKKKSPLWVYVSPSIFQTYNKLCAPFENKMREIYFYKEVCFVSFIEVCSLSLIMFLVGSMRSIHLPIAEGRKDRFMPFTRILVQSLTQSYFSGVTLWDQINISVALPSMSKVITHTNTKQLRLLHKKIYYLYSFYSN